MNYNGKSKLSSITFKQIVCYYKDLALNHERKTIPEFANELGLNAVTIQRFWEIAYSGPDNGKFSDFDQMLLSCTTFRNPCQYKEDQNLLGEQLKRRRYIRSCIKDFIAEQNKNNEQKIKAK